MPSSQQKPRLALCKFTVGVVWCRLQTAHLNIQCSQFGIVLSYAEVASARGVMQGLPVHDIMKLGVVLGSSQVNRGQL